MKAMSEVMCYQLAPKGDWRRARPGLTGRSLNLRPRAGSAVSDERFVQRKIDRLAAEPDPRSRARDAKFERLVEDWKNAIQAHSITAKVAMHPSYQQMIGMGKEILPLIFGRITRQNEKSAFWFWALASISAENPVPPEIRGNVREMTRAWLSWGEANGYVHMD